MGFRVCSGTSVSEIFRPQPTGFDQYLLDIEVLSFVIGTHGEAKKANAVVVRERNDLSVLCPN